jgi:multiple sugar transport system permease protein
MKLHKKGFRRFGVGVILSWSLVPIYWVINTSFQTDAQISDTPAHLFPPTPGWANYKALLIGDGELPSMIRRATINIFIECISATIITVVLASLAAYAFARMEFKGRKFFLFVVVMTMAFPTYTTLIPMYRIMAMVHLVNTYLGIILCYVSGFLPLATWILFSYMQSLPLAIEEAGSVDGASRMQIFRLIVLPLTMPAIASTAVITFLFAWAQFIFPLVLASDQSTQPLTVIVAAIQGRHIVPYSLLSTAGVIALSVPAVIALLTNRFIVSGLINGSVK